VVRYDKDDIYSDMHDAGVDVMDASQSVLHIAVGYK